MRGTIAVGLLSLMMLPALAHLPQVAAQATAVPLNCRDVALPGTLAVLAARWLGLDVFGGFRWDHQDILQGVVAIAPLCLLSESLFHCVTSAARLLTGPAPLPAALARADPACDHPVFRYSSHCKPHAGAWQPQSSLMRCLFNGAWGVTLELAHSLQISSCCCATSPLKLATKPSSTSMPPSWQASWR